MAVNPLLDHIHGDLSWFANSKTPLDFRKGSLLYAEANQRTSDRIVWAINKAHNDAVAVIEIDNNEALKRLAENISLHARVGVRTFVVGANSMTHARLGELRI